MNANDLKTMPIVDELRKKGESFDEIAKLLKTENMRRIEGQHYPAPILSNLFIRYKKEIKAQKRAERENYDPTLERQKGIDTVYRQRAIDALMKTSIKDREALAHLIQTGELE